MLNIINIINQVLTILWEVISLFFKAIGSIVRDNLPLILQIKKVFAYLTPKGVIALITGLPIGFFTIVFFIIKRLKR